MAVKKTQRLQAGMTCDTCGDCLLEAAYLVEDGGGKAVTCYACKEVLLGLRGGPEYSVDTHCEMCGGHIRKKERLELTSAGLNKAYHMSCAAVALRYMLRRSDDY